MVSKPFDLALMEETYRDFYAPSFSVTVGGKDIQRAGAQIISVNVDNDLSGADTFSFTINNPFNPGNGEFEWLDNGIIQNEKEVAIQMGYADKMELMIRGIISSIKASFGAGGASQLQVSGYDLSYPMMKGKKEKSWNEKTDSQAVEEIVNQHGLTKGRVEDSSVVFPLIKQDNESDFDFVKKSAERNGFEFYVFNREFFFIAPPANPEVVAILHYGKTLAGFSPEITSVDQVSEVKVTGWDTSSKQEIVGTARAPDAAGGNGSVEEIRKPVYSVAEATRLAEAVLSKIMRGRVKGSGECLGLPILKPGKGIELQGLGSRFSTTYYLEKTTHAIGTSGYKTTFNAREAGV